MDYKKKSWIELHFQSRQIWTLKFSIIRIQLLNIQKQQLLGFLSMYFNNQLCKLRQLNQNIFEIWQI
jgi:hypothetical protein